MTVSELMIRPSVPSPAEHLSHSQLQTYASCPLKWWFSRRNPSPFVPSALLFGSAFHDAVQAGDQARLEGREPDLSDMLQVFTATWQSEPRPIRYGKTENRESLFSRADAMLRAVLADMQPSHVIALEEPFQFRIDPLLPPIHGRIDLVEIGTDASGQKELRLVDWKTSSRKPSSIEATGTDQLILYHMAMKHSHRFSEYDLPVRLQYRIVTKTKTPEVVRQALDPCPLLQAGVAEKVRRIHSAIQAGAIYPNPGWMCSGCPYADECARWPDCLNHPV